MAIIISVLPWAEYCHPVCVIGVLITEPRDSETSVRLSLYWSRLVVTEAGGG